ncbi:DNA-binding protein WhiA [Corynebacterium lizhenjunii]|uniref:DNA-binding protein WhiA n=1 Tax=Corynebacterium lizhenjunii TaxID=2709394 RepID=UPI001F410FC2|nr:DNA-binding protein WhiA [Corynebacterium lizhenjunii]
MTVSLTDKVKQELTAVTVTRQSSRAAEAAAILRFAGELRLGGEEPTFEAEVDTPAVAKRLSDHLDELYGVRINGHVSGPGSAAKKPRVLLQVPQARDVARRLGLITRSGHAVIGLPPQVVSGSVADAEAAWRGAFLAQGILTEPGRSSSLEILCPCQEAALALVGCARRLGVVAKTKETRGADRVVIRDGDAIGALLTRMGAHRTRLEWEKKRLRSEAHDSSQSRLENFDDANQRRSARAAEQAANRVARAMEILGDDVPEHLADAGFLRVKYREASLEELGRHADPPMTKDAVAGRIRRLLSMADKRAEELKIPNTLEYATTNPEDAQ